MNIDDTINKIRQEYSQARENCSKKFKETLVDKLKELGLFETDVYIKKSGKKGVLGVFRNGYDISWEVKFMPYKKDGTLSEKSEPLYIYYFGNFEESLMEKITKECPT